MDLAGENGGRTTAAFELAALEALADPKAAFTDARRWADHLGIVGDEPTYAMTNFARRQQLDIEFHSGPRSERESLPEIGAQPEFDADRYVLIGVSGEEVVEGTRWEYVPLEEAATSSDWQLTDEHASRDGEEDSREGWP